MGSRQCRECISTRTAGVYISTLHRTYAQQNEDEKSKEMREKREERTARRACPLLARRVYVSEYLKIGAIGSTISEQFQERPMLIVAAQM